MQTSTLTVDLYMYIKHTFWSTICNYVQHMFIYTLQMKHIQCYCTIPFVHTCSRSFLRITQHTVYNDCSESIIIKLNLSQRLDGVNSYILSGKKIYLEVKKKIHLLYSLFPFFSGMNYWDLITITRRKQNAVCNICRTAIICMHHKKSPISTKLYELG
jgi:hypothetical protein